MFCGQTASLSKTWTNFTSDVQEAWRLVQNWLTKRWIDVMNLFGDLTDEQAAAAKQMADQDFADTAAGIEQRRSGALTEREQRRQSERGQSAAVNEATLAEIGAPPPVPNEQTLSWGGGNGVSGTQ